MRLFFAFFCIFCFSESVGKSAFFYGNFDNDNIADKIVVSESSNGVSSHYLIACYFSTKNKPFRYYCSYSYSDFYFTCPIPDIVTNQIEFADSLCLRLVPTATKQFDIFAFNWAKDISDHQRNLTDSCYSLVSGFSLRWTKNLPKFMNPAYQIVTTDRFIRSLGSGPKSVFFSKRTILFYMANNHRIASRKRGSRQDFMVTDHGVMMKNAKGYAWLFINEFSLFGTGPQKLRWRSITDIVEDENSLRINTISIPSEIKTVYIVCLRHGVLYRCRGSCSDSLEICPACK